MRCLVLDAGAVTALGRRNRQAAARIAALRRRGLWPPILPAVVVIESLTGNRVRDTLVNRIMELSMVHPLEGPLTRRAAQLRGRARAGSAVEASVVATAEHLEAVVITANPDGLARLSRNASGVVLLPIGWSEGWTA